MPSEDTKGIRELEIFQDFVKRSALRIDPDSVEKRKPPEPDILCKHFDEGIIAFELVELCDPALAARLNDTSLELEFVYTSDPSLNIIRRKRTRSYQTEYPIELLCYTDGRIVTPDDVIIPTIRPYFECNPGEFRRVWFRGDSTVEIVYDGS
jgi:hypothetical protein